MSFYDKINNEVNNDSDAALGFCDLVINTLLNALKKECLNQFENLMYSIDSEIKKEDNIKEANNIFQ